MPSKKKQFSRSKRYNHTIIRKNKNKLKKIQTGGTKSDILVEISPGNWENARPYQKKAFRDFIQRYQTGSTFDNKAGNFNPENNLVYHDKSIRFTVLGEIYIVREGGSRMRIKSVLRPEGSPEPDYDNEKPAGPNDKYFFSTSEGNLYFNNTLNKEITDNKKLSKHFTIDKYQFFLSPDEVQIEGQAIKNIGVVRINSSDYPLFYSFIPGYVFSGYDGPPPPGLPPNNAYSTTKPTESGNYYYVVCDGITYYFSPTVNKQLEEIMEARKYVHGLIIRYTFGMSETFHYIKNQNEPHKVVMFGKTLNLESSTNK